VDLVAISNLPVFQLFLLLVNYTPLLNILQAAILAIGNQCFIPHNVLYWIKIPCGNMANQSLRNKNPHREPIQFFTSHIKSTSVRLSYGIRDRARLNAVAHSSGTSSSWLKAIP